MKLTCVYSNILQYLNLLFLPSFFVLSSLALFKKNTENNKIINVNDITRSKPIKINSKNNKDNRRKQKVTLQSCLRAKVFKLILNGSIRISHKLVSLQLRY